MIRLLTCGLLLCATNLGPAVWAADLPMMRASGDGFARDGENALADGGAQADDINITLELPSFFATADGPRMEGSDSLISKMVVPKAATLSMTEMQVRLSGHIVKTAGSVARIDVEIGTVRRSFTWASDEVKSGRFELTFTESIQDGRIPPFFPVSAIALVTRETRDSVVMVSLEKIGMTLTSARVAEGGLRPESTAVWPDLAP